MKKYTRQQIIGDIAEAYCSYRFISGLNVIYRHTASRDTGVDGEIELTKEIPSEKDRHVTGKIIKVQIKGTEQEKVNNVYKVNLTDQDIHYLRSELTIPSIVVLKPISEETFYWKAVNKSIIERKVVEFTDVHKFNEKEDLNLLQIFHWFSSIRKSNEMIREILIDQILDVKDILKIAPEEIKTKLKEDVSKRFELGNDMGKLLRKQLKDYINYEPNTDKIGKELIIEIEENFEIFSKENLNSVLKDIK